MKKLIKTKILNQDISSIKKASKLLRDDQLVSFPTETVYGLGASAVSNVGVAKIFFAKGRPKYNPLIIHLANKQEVHDWAFVPKAAETLIESFWPGPLTLVLNKKKVSLPLASLVTGNLDTVAIRVPLHATARALIRELGNPIAAPSANISGRISPTRYRDVLLNMGGKISALIKGDNCSVGLESTIISFASGDPVLLRPGGIPTEVIETKLGEKVIKHQKDSSEMPSVIAPGMMEAHYAPKTKLKLNETNPKSGQLFLGFGEMPIHALGLNLSQAANLNEAAANFFATLTDIDAMAQLMKITTIHVAPIPATGLGIAINDRLKRAATKKI